MLMFRLRDKRNKRKFDWELKLIGQEISRSKKFMFSFGILGINLSSSAPRGLSKLLPGRTLSLHLLEKNIRYYDKLLNYAYKIYLIILPQAKKDDINEIKERIYSFAQDYKWGEIYINTAVYPEDGEDPRSLLKKVVGEDEV